MKSAAATIEALTSSQIQEMLADSSPLRIEIEGRQFELTKEQIVLHRIERPGLRVQSDGSLVVALDAHISEQLAQEGIARDIVRHVQNLRKQSGHAVTDRIDLTIAGPKRSPRHWRHSVITFRVKYWQTRQTAKSCLRPLT